MSLFEMSISGGVMIVVIVLIRVLAINRLPKTTFIALWMIALARLLIPVSIPSVFSVYSLFDRVPSIPVAEQSENIAALTAAPSAGAHAVTMPVLSPVSEVGAESAAVSFSLVWLVGAVVAFAAFGAAYFLCFRMLKKAEVLSADSVSRWLDSHRIRRTVVVKSSGRVSTPLTYGVFRPVIILPDSMDTSDTEQLDYVLGHEFAHIRRFDLLRKLAVILAVCLHWFNPLVWMMLVVFNRDIELACDETVVSGAGFNSRKSYAMALIDMEEKRSVAGTLYSCFNRNAVEERIVAIMKITRPTFIRLAISAAIVLVVCLGFATTAYANQDKNKREAEPPAVSASAPDVVIDPSEVGSLSEITSEDAWDAPEKTTGTEPENKPEVTTAVEPEDIPDTTADKAAAAVPGSTTAPAPEPVPETAACHNWIWPVNSDRITRNFGPSSNPDRGSSDHITIACGHGDRVVSAISGNVAEATFAPEYGNYVVICGEGGVRTLYGHLEEILVTVGQTVSAGDRIGTAGATGMVTGVCLSFYVYVNDQPVNPVSFYE